MCFRLCHRGATRVYGRPLEKALPVAAENGHFEGDRYYQGVNS